MSIMPYRFVLNLMDLVLSSGESNGCGNFCFTAHSLSAESETERRRERGIERRRYKDRDGGGERS